MRIRSICVVLSFFLASGILSLAKRVDSQVDPYPAIEIPVMPGGYDITMVFGHPKKTKSLNYFIRAEYPAAEVLQFYDSKFKEIGYDAAFDKAKRQWECFVEETIDGDRRVRQLLALWINPELKVEAFLALRYVKGGKHWGNEIHVFCQIQPLIDTTRLEKFLRQPVESKQHAEFMKLLDSYRTPDGEVDIDKAISENPDNDYLREYKRIIDEMTREKGGRS